MATLDNIEISYDRKVQLQKFEPITVGAVAAFSLKPDDDPYQVYQQGQESVQAMVERELAERIARKKLVEVGPSVPKVKAVIREQTEVLDDDTISAIAEGLVEQA
ncbi:hypothetical protein HRTV-25_gp65 [Halorubrum tailed virus 25]|uniref:Uncharacterized protein n=1 Tax=Halorubrum tailed virus 25 TaxID=2878006 RepID=A0AAE9BZ37_9CAUD|nr:hypothetical protein M1M37_gp065 [Halorubrum tailed virus 25]UBF22646.1 hypothetical protein HRTV-25_gp65 [Halorubrum tailed virus 25]